MFCGCVAVSGEELVGIQSPGINLNAFPGPTTAAAAVE